jgi:hypothetical protein
LLVPPDRKKEVSVLSLLRNWAHLIRPAIVLLAGVGLFLVIRAAVIPKDFGKYGHYRAGALESIRQRPISFAGQGACVLCHEEQAKVRATGKHAPVACEACHGALAQHANDPGSLKPTLPDTAVLCRRCHEKDAAKPKGFPQVATAEHSGGMACNGCHQPHSPRI